MFEQFVSEMKAKPYTMILLLLVTINSADVRRAAATKADLQKIHHMSASATRMALDNEWAVKFLRLDVTQQTLELETGLLGFHERMNGSNTLMEQRKSDLKARASRIDRDRLALQSEQRKDYSKLDRSLGVLVPERQQQSSNLLNLRLSQ